MTTTYPRECARCGNGKPPWFKYCPKCYAIVQVEQLKPNTCDEQDCEEVIKDEHLLCGTHYQQFREGKISECPECGEYKPANYPLCRRCNTEAKTPTQRQPQQTKTHDEAPLSRTSNTRRPYDHHDGTDDQKAKDKRQLFNHQGNGVCNYCGDRYPYDQLEMDHMIPKELVLNQAWNGRDRGDAIWIGHLEC